MKFNFRPEAYILNYESEREKRGKIKSFSTYRELKKNIKSLIKDSPIGKVIVNRVNNTKHKFWVEYWKLDFNGEPFIYGTNRTP